MLPFVSIVMPNFNGGGFVVETINSLIGLDYPPERFEIIVVDNSSTDDSLKAVRKEYALYIDSGRLKVIENDANRGAPAAYNTGIKNADSNYDYILKLDNDIVLDRQALLELVKCAESDPKIGMTGGKVFYYADRKRLHLIGSSLSPVFAGGIGIGKNIPDNADFNRDRLIDAVNGCMMLVRRELIEKVGLMDERYFLYYDDLDWVLRARSKGFKNKYCHKAIAYHNTSQPEKRFQSQRWLYYAIFNSFYFMKKHYGGFSFFVFFIADHIKIFYYLLKVLLNNSARRKELVKVIIKAYTEGIGSLWKKE